MAVISMFPVFCKIVLKEIGCRDIWCHENIEISIYTYKPESVLAPGSICSLLF
jgi:hypothetical protein